MQSKKLSVNVIKEYNFEQIKETRKALLRDGTKTLIDTLNWAEDFPHQPKVELHLAHCKEGLWLDYNVQGQDLRTLSPADGNYVHTDSCVEFFMQKEQGESYINFEFNAAGICYAAHHQSIKESTLLSADEFKTIKRWGTYLGEKHDIANEDFTWRLTVFIPWETMGYEAGETPKTFFANFYKCGDETAHPHFVSWSPIDEPSPAFHRPQFFGEIELI